MNPKTTITKNINRRKLIVDKDIQFYKNIPVPSWIELSLIDVCNRSCSFCPKSDPKIAPLYGNGWANTGAGGGGSSNYRLAYEGGSGVVIISYPT